jgi:hypothetical protein
VGLIRHRSLQVTQRDTALLPRIQQLKAEHPFWGYRRIWAYLHFVEQQLVSKKRVLRLMREHDLFGHAQPATQPVDVSLTMLWCLRHRTPLSPTEAMPLGAARRKVVLQKQLDSAKHGGVVDPHATFPREFCHIAIAQRVVQYERTAPRIMSTSNGIM